MNLPFQKAYSPKTAMFLYMAGISFVDKNYFLSLRGGIVKDDLSIALTKLARHKAPNASDLFENECMTLGEVLMIGVSLFISHPGRFDRLTEDTFLSGVCHIINSAIIVDPVTERMNDIIQVKKEIFN